MPLRKFDLLPSVAMPAVNDTMREINETLQDKTMADFVLYRPHLAESLRDCVMPKQPMPTKTMKDISEDKDLNYTRLMMAIPREVALSVARHTMAYDYAPRVHPTTRPRPPYTYSGDYKGAYAASIAIRGRDGKFLTPKEFRTLIAGMNAYVRACSHWSDSGDKWLPDPTSDDHRMFIRAVDTTYNKPATDDVPRWGNTTAAIRNIWALIGMMTRYLRVPNLPDDDPIKQSPIMVGCTLSPMKDRCRAHLPESRMGSTTHTWALTLSLLKHMGLSPEVISIPVLVTLEPGDLRVAERLVTALAQSHIGQIGYNIVEAGRTTDAHRPAMSGDFLLEMQYHLYIEPGFTLKQSKVATKELQRRKEIWEELNTVIETEYEGLLEFKKEAENIVRRKAEFMATRNAVELAFNDLEKNAKAAKEKLDKIQEEAEERLNCHHAIAILVRAMGLKDDTDNEGGGTGKAGEKTGNAEGNTGNAGEKTGNSSE